MKAAIQILWIAVVVSTFPSCANQPIENNPQAKLLMSATGRFFDMKEAGKLPGIKPDDHGNLNSFPERYEEEVTYPFSVLFRVTKELDSSRYYYRFTKNTRSSDWQLGEMWRVGSDNQREELKSE